MFRKSFYGIFVLLIAFGTSYAQQTEYPKVEFDVRYWITDLASRARVSGGLLEATEFNVKDDLGLDDEDIPEFRFAGRVASRHKLRFEYFQVGYSGDKNLTRTIVFEGREFDVTTRVVSDFDLKHLRAGYAWQLINRDKVRLGPLVEIRGIWLDAQLAAPEEGASESKKFSAPFPTFGADLDVLAHPKAQVFASVSGLPGSSLGHLLDADFGVKLFPLENVGVTAGYRYLDVKGKDDDDFATVKIKGPAIGITFRF